MKVPAMTVRAEDHGTDTLPGMSHVPFHIPSLDGIRALAFASVFCAHAWSAHLGMFGVTVFFFLSGYLITTLLRRENDRTGTVSLRNFYFRRTLRIFPPLYLTLLLIALLTACHLLGRSVDLPSFAAVAMFFTNYWAIFHCLHGAGLMPFWSLAVEEHFYLLFPPLFLLFIRRRWSYKAQAVALSGLCGALLAWRLVLALCFADVGTMHMLYGSDTRFDSILFGCIMALVANPVLDHHVVPSKVWTSAATLSLLASFAIQNSTYRATVHYTIQGIALIPIFILVICRADTWFRWLNGKFIGFVGTLSYTMYLVHLSLMYVAARLIHTPAIALSVTLSATFLFAVLMHSLVERPLVRIRKRLDSPRLARTYPVQQNLREA